MWRSVLDTSTRTSIVPRPDCRTVLALYWCTRTAPIRSCSRADIVEWFGFRLSNITSSHQLVAHSSSYDCSNHVYLKSNKTSSSYLYSCWGGFVMHFEKKDD